MDAADPSGGVPAAPRRAFRRAAWGGASLALALDVLMLSAGHLSLWRQMGLLGSFYDIQGRALLHGHLAVPPGSLSFEGFVVGGHTYMYFGLVPAILRLPMLALTHALDGRMTQLSMLGAYLVLLAAGERAAWRVRLLVSGPEKPISRSERFVAGVLLFALGAGAVPLFLASWPAVYHEAALWGAALSLAALGEVLGFVLSPSRRGLALAGLLTLLATNTRVSVALGPVIALALLAGVALLRERDWRRGGALLAVALLALAPAVAINEARFHSAFGVPLNRQLDTAIDPSQRAFVAAYHGAATGLRFIPTTLLATIRPDAVGGVRGFPFIGLPSSPPHVIGGARFNALLPALSAPTSMPLLSLLALVGLAGVLRLARARRCWPVLLGAAAGYLPALSFGSTATRYLTDLLPFLFLAACVGVASAAELRALRLRAARVRRLALAGAALLALVGTVIDGSVGLVQQQLLAPTDSPATRAAFVRLQDSVDRFLARRPGGIRTGSSLPAAALGAPGDLFVLGRCDGLYAVGFQQGWLPVERTARSGLHRLAVRFGAGRSGVSARVLALTGRRSQLVLLDRPDGPGRAVRFTLTLNRRPIATGPTLAVRYDRETPVTVSIDPLATQWFLSVRVGAALALTVPVPYERTARAVLGPSARTLPEPTPTCDQLARRARLF